MENNKSKMELYEEKQKQNKKTLDKQEIADIEFSRKRHQENEEQWETFMIILKMPYYIFFKLPKWLIGKITFTEKRHAQEKEIERLKRVIESKARAREMMELENIIKWDNKYLIKDGIFNIGKDIKTGKLITVDFNINSNLLVGGMPGTGKTKFIQLVIFQCLKHGCKVYIGDFKGGVDFMRFNNKCEVITEHRKLLELLLQFKKEIKRRQKLFIDAGAENLKEYNQITRKNLKREYLFIDELGEAIEIIEVEGMKDSDIKKLRNDVENNLKSIARLGRAFGLNLICGTQRPDVGILEGQTRDQFGYRICFKAIHTTSNIVLSSKIASELPDIKGRAVIMQGVKYIEIQVFFWDKETLTEINNKKLDKNDLKIVKGNTENDKNIETIDIDLD